LPQVAAAQQAQHQHQQQEQQHQRSNSGQRQLWRNKLGWGGNQQALLSPLSAAEAQKEWLAKQASATDGTFKSGASILPATPPPASNINVTAISHATLVRGTLHQSETIGADQRECYFVAVVDAQRRCWGSRQYIGWLRKVCLASELLSNL
jgi:hypothetical protein